MKDQRQAPRILLFLEKSTGHIESNLTSGRVLIWMERGCVADQPQHFRPAAADASRTAALRPSANQDTTWLPAFLTSRMSKS